MTRRSRLILPGAVFLHPEAPDERNADADRQHDGGARGTVFAVPPQHEGGPDDREQRDHEYLSRVEWHGSPSHRIDVGRRVTRPAGACPREGSAPASAVSP